MKDRAASHAIPVLREVALSIAVNAALSAVFAYLMFGAQERVELWGAHGLVVDFVPQTFIIAFMATLVPSAVARKALRRSGFHKVDRRPVKLPHNLFVRSLLVAGGVSLFAIPIAVILFAFTAPRGLPFAAVLMMKIAYGATIACLVTPCALNVVLREGADS